MEHMLNTRWKIYTIFTLFEHKTKRNFNIRYFKLIPGDWKQTLEVMKYYITFHLHTLFVRFH